MGLDIAAYFFEVNSWYFGGLGYASIAPVVPSSMIVLVGGVGMCEYSPSWSSSYESRTHLSFDAVAHFRPLDCHWHLMLTLDWCTFVISLANVVVSTGCAPKSSSRLSNGFSSAASSSDRGISSSFR